MERPEQTFEELGQVEKLRRENAKLWSQLKEASAADAGRLAIAEALREQIPIRPVVPTARVPRLNQNRQPVGGILDLSDWHFGEVVDLESTGNMWQYNPDIAAERFDYTVEQGIELAREHKMGEMVVILGGDMISGNIHDDLNRTNEMMVVNQTLAMSEVVTGGFEKLAGSIKLIRALSVSGNHPRLEKIPHFKFKQSENLDYMLDAILQLKLKNQKNIEWMTKKSFWNLFEIESRRFLTMHGDTNKQQQSQGLSYYAIEKDLRKYLGMVTDGSMPHFHDMISHHLHTYCAVPVGGAMAYINGSGKGPDEYTQAGTRPVSPARQRFLAVSGGRVVADRAIELMHIGGPHRDTQEDALAA